MNPIIGPMAGFVIVRWRWVTIKIYKNIYKIYTYFLHKNKKKKSLYKNKKKAELYLFECPNVILKQGAS